MLFRSLLLCLALYGSVATSPTPCSSDDDQCIGEQSVSLLQTKLEVVNNEPEGHVHYSHKTQPQSPGLLQKQTPQPFFTVETMPKVSTTLKCIINLGTQYFALYTALAIVRTLKEFKYDFVGLEKILETGVTTITYAPMLCALFLGSRMRAIQLSQGETEKYALPQPWVQNAMLASSYAVLLQCLLVLLVGFVSGMGEVRTDKEGNLDVSTIQNTNPMAVRLLTVLRYVVMAMLYGGFCVVTYGIFTMEAPKAIWGDQEVPVSPAVQCTVYLASLFFVIYTFVAITTSAFELAPSLRQTPGLEKLQNGAASAKMTVNFAPMICVLFIGARLRALQIDPKNGHPQDYAQKCFFMCTFSILIQAFLVIVLPFVAGGECKKGECEGDVAFVMENATIGAVLTAVRYACLLGLYGGVSAVVYSIVTIQSPEGPDKTPAVSPAMQCVTSLTAQYFLVYTGLFVSITIKSFLTENSAAANIATKWINIFDAGRNTVMFAPMLSCLFLGTRMRALQLAKDTSGNVPPTAGPQKWVQDCMFLATGALFVQLLTTMLVSLLIGGDKTETDQDGNVKVPSTTNKFVAYLLVIVRYGNLISMYFGASGIVIGVLLMTPEELQPYSTKGLFPSSIM